MNCKYNIGGKIRDCFYSQYSDMSVYGDDSMTEIGNYVLQKDENGKRYFEVDGQKIMFEEDLVCDTPQEYIDNIKNRFGDYLCAVLVKHGIDCLTVKCKVKPIDIKRIDFGDVILSVDVTPSNERVEDYDWVEYKFINNEFNRNPEDGFKLLMTPKDESLIHVYPNKDLYVNDLVTLIRTRPDLYQLSVSDEFKEREASANA